MFKEYKKQTSTMPSRIYYKNLHTPAGRLISHTPLNVTSVSHTETSIKKVLRIQEFIYKGRYIN